MWFSSDRKIASPFRTTYNHAAHYPMMIPAQDTEINMPTPDHTPPMIRTNHSNAFANHTMGVRLPKIIRRVRDLNPDYPASVRRNLDALGNSMGNDDPIPMLDLPAPDYDAWATAHAVHEQDTWLNTDWFFAETFAYRHIIQAVRWWENSSHVD